MILIAALFALALKRFAEVDETLPETNLAKDNEWVQRNLPSQAKESSPNYKPLSKELVKNAREKRLLELKMGDVTLEIIVYVMYILFALLIAYGHQHPDAYKATSNMETIFVKGKFDKVSLFLVFMTTMNDRLSAATRIGAAVT